MRTNSSIHSKWVGSTSTCRGAPSLDDLQEVGFSNEERASIEDPVTWVEDLLTGLCSPSFRHTFVVASLINNT